MRLPITRFAASATTRRRLPMLALLSSSINGFSMGMPAVGAARAAVRMSTLADFSANKIDGSAVDFKSFLGKPTLVLNVASL